MDWDEKGVGQGRIVSPDLFSLYSQKAMEELKYLEGLRVSGVNVNNIRHAYIAVVETLHRACAARVFPLNSDEE